jgi:hypothetical protein
MENGMNKSESIKELASALSKAQAMIEGAIKDKTNPAFRSKYADLGACWDACRDPLTKHGLSVMQLPMIGEGSVRLETILMHSSGEFISSEMQIPVSKHDAQGYGSALTYARRYALCAFVGIAPEDDDGNGASAKAPAKQANPENERAALVKKLNAAARRGSVSLRDAWESLTPAQRHEMADMKDDLKSAAAMQDEAIATQA